MNEQEFKEELQKININLTDNQLNKLNIYLEKLLEYNIHTNLTAIKDKEGVYLKHFYDSLTIKNYIKSDTKILDIGTGAGFPGMVLAILCPNTKFVLLDSNNKKIKFLEYLNTFLNLENVEFIYERAEDYVRKNQEQFDIVTGRAVKELRILAELSIPALKINGLFIPLKSNISEEQESFKETISILNAQIKEIKEFNLPYNGGKRTIIITQKISKTSELYPRSYDKILKKPLKKNYK